MKQFMKCKWMLVVFFLGIFLFGGHHQASAAVSTIFVEDEAGILSDKDKTFIRDMNEKTFKALEGQPQYAVVILKNLPRSESIEDYTTKKFQTLGVGQKGLDNGFLFVIAIEDREYRLETGYGVEAVITDSMKSNIVSSEVEDTLKDEKYSDAVLMISRNVERIVKERYGNYAASLESVEKEKVRNKNLLSAGILVVLSASGLSVLGIAGYYLKRKRIQRYLEKNVVSSRFGFRYFDRSKNEKYSDEASSADLTALVGLLQGGAKGPIKQVEFVKQLAILLHKKGNWRKWVQDSSFMKETVTDLLLTDGIISYWESHPDEGKYTIEVYLEHRRYNELLALYEDKLYSESRLLEKNPLISQQGDTVLKDYIETVTHDHQLALEITENNKDLVRSQCRIFVKQAGVKLRNETDYDLHVSLMMYHILRGKDLSQAGLVSSKLVSEDRLNKASKFASKKSKEIEPGYRQQAIADLSTMMLGSYYLHSTMMWSSYQSSSSSSSGGSGSSFGGGSSGGGGFSGSW